MKRAMQGSDPNPGTPDALVNSVFWARPWSHARTVPVPRAVPVPIPGPVRYVKVPVKVPDTWLVTVPIPSLSP